MQRAWEPEQLIACWTLDEADWQLLANKTGATRLGFALMLKFFDLEGRFPTSTGELPPAAVDYVARLVNVAAGELGSYGWSGRTIEYHRAQIRSERGFGEATVDDEQQLAGWLARELCPVELDDTRLREDLLARCREQRMEPPARLRLERILNSGRAQFERQFTTGTVARLPAAAIERLEQLAARDEDAAASAGVLAELKSDPGRSSLNTVLEEIDKLERVLALGLPPGLFADCSEKLIAAWRARAAAAYPSDLRAMPQPTRLTLLAVLCWSRTAEITDSLVDLLIDVVHKIRARAENRVEKELVRDLKRVRGKQGLLFALAEAAVEHPDDTVRSALFPVVSETTLRQLVKEAKASEQIFQQQVRKVIRGSYSNHYRRMLPRLLQTLEFRCSNSAYRPVMDALELLGRHVDTPGQQRFYAPGEHVPLDSVVPDEWRQAVVDEHAKVERIPYELCVLRALRDALRRREIHVAGAQRWRNPDEDLPGDFDENRDVHYAAIRKPRDPAAFIADLQRCLHAGLERLNHAISSGTAGGVRIATRHGKPWIVVPPLGRLPEPPNLKALHGEIEARHGTINLLDVLKDADHLSRFTLQLTSVASREITDPETARRRKLLVSFGIGSNIGIKRIADAIDGHPADTEAALRRFRRIYFNRDGLRRAIAEVVNKTLELRDAMLWGEGTACTSDSKQFGSWDSNLMTEWHARYGGPGVMVYWHVERKQLCIYSQLTTCSASEVAAMLQGLLHHDTDAEIESNITDSHGASIIGFAFCELLDFRLMPRFKQIGKLRLYGPGLPTDKPWTAIAPVISARTIDWDLIAQNYDELVRYATALKLGTAEAQQLLRRFVRGGPRRPAHQALDELGRVGRTIFLCNYLADEEVRHEVHEGRQVIEH
jgi:TnpA family transposase